MKSEIPMFLNAVSTNFSSIDCHFRLVIFEADTSPNVVCLNKLLMFCSYLSSYYVVFYLLFIQCMMIIWLGAYVSFGLIIFGTSMPEFGTASRAIGYLTALLTYSYNFTESALSSYEQITCWELFSFSFVFLAFGSMTSYVSIEQNSKFFYVCYPAVDYTVTSL